MEPFESVRIGSLLEDLRALPETEMRLVLATAAVAAPEVLSLALAYVQRVAEYGSEPTGG